MSYSSTAPVDTASSNHLGNATIVRPLDASTLAFQRTTNPRPVPTKADQLKSLGSICTDHMITAKWNSDEGWSSPKLEPYGPLPLMPTASVLHYATECFEGMKAYRGYDGKLRLFRPNCNTERMLMSATRISLPAFDPSELEKLIIALMATDGPKWLAKSEPGSYLYLRPTLIGTTESLNPQVPKDALLFIIASYFTIFPDDPSRGLKLLASEDDAVRAWPGGFGYAKVGANYGPTLAAQRDAKERGYQQVLWLFGRDGQVTEAGASNLFIIWRTRDNKLQLVTAPLDDKIILDGVTRRSIVQLARERLSIKREDLEALEVVERTFTMNDVAEAYQEDRLLEAFAAGTAYFIAPVEEIHFRGTDIHLPTGDRNLGKYSKLLKDWLQSMMLGLEEHEWGVVVQEEHDMET